MLVMVRVPLPVLVSEPAAIRKVLVENCHDYRKSALERRILSPRLRSGLVALEGEPTRLYFVGRRDAMIKSAGNRISPQEIEDAALASGLVAEAVALGLPDERLGQLVHLVVRPVPGATDFEDKLPRFLLRELPNFMQPKTIHWCDAMPIGPNGKIDRTGLYQDLSS